MSFVADLYRNSPNAGMAEFQEKLRLQHENSMLTELEKLLTTAKPSEAEISRKDFEGFKKLFHRFLQEKGPSVDWAKIQRPPEGSIQPYEKIELKGLPADVASSLNKLAVVKLNGGLGTSMGCKGPKSLISVRNENTFLDLTVQQIEHLNKSYNADVPLVLMNSFNTDEDTKKILQKYTHHRVKIHTFNQSRYPRISKESLLPVATNMGLTAENEEAWYPPGHGDIYASFYNSGLLDKLIAEGKEYIFVSNIDNLGATVDLHILNHLMSQPSDKRCEFVMEVTDKTRADVKVSGATMLMYRSCHSVGYKSKGVRDFLKRFESIPDMLELDHLTVSGDVTFGKQVTLKGTVIIIANHGDRIDIPAGAMLENKIVSGNLRILDH
ncbi:UTP--glucose-1-phosphate uridylyltransferase-like [Sinocyclocheilus grahami]|uniref:UTP--glucose-1-phosphate uridylyltransferase-like n=1 Tax=Sinocyclocheilus grahami TaxID=75366 RepID=UPI0007AC694D|nr:PREDICTED: UTP--glucose-1-phosphate uridylyltransferase-like [Sinocyclocheilus grahami]